MSEPTNSLPLQPVWGAIAIARIIGKTPRATFHMLHRKQLPATKVGNQWVADKAALEEIFRPQTAE